MDYDLNKATFPPSLAGYDPTKAAFVPSGPRASLSMTRAKQAPATSTDHPLAGHSPPKARYSPKSAKGRRITDRAFREVDQDEPKIVGQTRRKRGAAAAARQKTAIALSKARRAGVRIPKRGS